jgi:ankyrin repeat protein
MHGGLSVSSLPERPHLGHLRKQAKELLRQFRTRDPDALARLRQYLPAAKGKSDAELSALPLQLRDAQSCIARQHGFPSWSELKGYVEWKASSTGRVPALLSWLRLVYAGDIAGGNGRAHPDLALRVLAEHPQLAHGDGYVACAMGDEEGVRRAIAADREWVNRPGGPLQLPPLVAVTQSSLVHAGGYRFRMRRCVQVLLEAGANPNQSVRNRWFPHSIAAPGDESLSALYGAAGQAQDPEMTRLLLVAGADPNDGESLYHSVANTECVRLLLEHGARPCSNTLANAVAHSNLVAVRLLLEHGADPNEINAQRISPLIFAIRGRRPVDIVKALLDAGADPRARTPEGQSAYGYACTVGLSEIATVLERAGAAEPLSIEDAFVAACARCDEVEARRLLDARPDLLLTLGPERLRYLPEMVYNGCDEPAGLMVRLGWPITARGGDEPFLGSALNWAVFRGNAAMTEFLLQHGASWTERHGYGDNVMGTLSWASRNQPQDFGDWVGCARALLAHGMPRAQSARGEDSHGPLRAVQIDGRTMEFSDEVAEVLLGL